MKRTIVSAVAVVLVVGVASAQTARTLPEKATGDDVREAILRYQISHWNPATTSYCVQVNGKDADEEFLRRLRPLAVKRASACGKRTPPKVPSHLYGIVDNQTHKPSVIFEIGEIRWVTLSEALVDGGYFCGSLCMARGTYRIVRDGLRWAVTAFDVHVLS